MSVKVREKELQDGRISLYLDIYHNKKRSYDFLEIYLEKESKSKPWIKKENQEKRMLADRIALDLDHRLKVQQRGLPDDKMLDVDLFTFIQTRSPKKQRRLAPLVKHLEEFSQAKRIPFRLIDKDWLLAFQGYLSKSDDRTENTVNNYMALLNNILNEAAQEDIIPFNPWKRVPSHLKAKLVANDIDPLEPGEIRKMIEHSDGVPSQIRQCFLFSIFTGLRWGDASNLTKSCIRTMRVEGKRRKFIVFTQRKTQTRKNFPLSSEAISMLAERLWDERRSVNERREAGIEAEYSENFFPFLSIKEGDRANKRHGIMHYYLKKWAAKAGIKKRVHYHLTRHTFATLGLEKIGDLHIVSSLLGHKRLVTTQRYAHVLDRLKVESIDRLSSYGILKK